jgi:hypothetical protein
MPENTTTEYVSQTRKIAGQMSSMAYWARQNETLILFGDYFTSPADGQYPKIQYSELAMHCQIAGHLAIALVPTFRDTGCGKVMSGLWVLSLDEKTGSTSVTNGLPDELVEPHILDRIELWLDGNRNW